LVGQPQIQSGEKDWVKSLGGRVSFPIPRLREKREEGGAREERDLAGILNLGNLGCLSSETLTEIGNIGMGEGHGFYSVLLALTGFGREGVGYVSGCFS
jgi:hypothetical protein